MIHANQLILRRGGKRLLDDVSFSVIGGEFVALLGPSGAGKSLLLRTLAGELTPSDGEVWLGGKKISDWSRRELATRRAVLAQGLAAQTPLSVFDVVLLGRAPHITVAHSQQDKQICEAALRWVDALALKGRAFADLSAGEQQQVHLARVLAQVWGRAQRGDCYVLLDEPMSHLDIWQQHRTMTVARQLCQQGAAVIMSLRDPNLAAQYADRIMLMRAGQVQAEGTPAQVFVPHIIERAYGVQVDIQPHPTLAFPCIMPAGAAAV